MLRSAVGVRGISMLAPCLIALMTSPLSAVPPPVPTPAQTIGLRAGGCPVDVSGSVRPYTPATFQFVGEAGNLLILALGKPNSDLQFGLAVDHQTPFITGAGFGAGDVRVIFPRSGTYELQVSAFDATLMKASSADFRLRLYLRDERNPDTCRSDR